MDYFCQPCAEKPKWEFDAAKAFMHSCQRCFQFRPCNDYAYKTGRVPSEPAPRPKDLVPKHVPGQTNSEANLPKVAGHREPVAAPATPVNEIPEGNEVDRALAAVQPNRPGIRLETAGGAKPAKPAAKPAPEPLAEKPKAT